MNQEKKTQVQQYMQIIFNNKNITIQKGQGKDAPDEVMINGEFAGVIYENEDDGEISYDFIMSILEEDLS